MHRYIVHPKLLVLLAPLALPLCLEVEVYKPWGCARWWVWSYGPQEEEVGKKVERGLEVVVVYPPQVEGVELQQEEAGLQEGALHQV